jgi:hypothetical protein
LERRQHRARVVAICLVVVTALSACSGLPDVAALKRMPEAALRAPSSTDLFHSEAEASSTVEGSSPAFVTEVVGTSLTPSEAMESLRGSLRGEGWQVDAVDSSGIATTAEGQAEAWRKGDTVVRISVLRKNDPRNPALDQAGRFTTIYQLTLLAKRPVTLSS